jgi:hypothetical protein
MLSRLRKGVVNFAHSLELIHRVMEKAAAGASRGHLIERRRTGMASDAATKAAVARNDNARSIRHRRQEKGRR